MNARDARGARAQGGVALLLVVWLLALLTVIAGEFMASGRVKAAAERNKADDLRGLALALAGYRAAVAALDEKIAGLGLDDEGRLLLRYPGAGEGVAAAADDVALGGGTYSWRISDEDGLVNVNTATRPVLENLLRLCGMPLGAERDTVVDSILDWRDTNSDHRLNGAEEDYYRGLDPPYSCKDGPLDVVEELLLVRGVTPRLYEGGEVEGRKRPGLRDVLSPRAPEVPNAATAPQEVLEACGLKRAGSPAETTAVSRHFVIVASGKPAGGSPPRTLRAVVLRKDAGSSRSFTLLYWNDSYHLE
jgi:type II secretory pathway component PulK